MARWQLTLEDPSGEIPSLTIATLAIDGNWGYSRTVIQQTSVEDFTQSGRAIVQGTITEYRYQWDITCMLTEIDALRLEAMAIAQDKKYFAQTDGYLYLSDEVEYLPIEKTPHSKTFVTGTSVTASGYTGGTWVYGFGKFKVKIQLADEPKVHAGYGEYAGVTGNMKRVSFSAIELTE